MKALSVTVLVMLSGSWTLCLGDCASFQQYWDHNYTSYYHRPYPPEARQCFPARAYIWQITDSGETIDLIDLHDDFVRVYTGMLRCENPANYQRIVAAQAQLDIATIDPFMAAANPDPITKAFAALTGDDPNQYAEAVAKYSNDFGRYLRLLRLWPEIQNHFRVTVPANMKRNLECLKHPLEVCQ